MQNPLVTRTLTAVIGLPLLLVTVWLGSIWFSILIIISSAIAAIELSNMAHRWGENTPGTAAILGSISLASFAHILINSSTTSAAIPPLIAATTFLAVIWLIKRRLHPNPMTTVITLLALIFYSAGFLFHAPLLRALDQGMEWILFLLLVTFATDTSAYFTGKAVGKRPLAPLISPSKTWEGAVGGIGGALGTSIAATFVLELNVVLAEAIALGILISVTGQLGDLAESRLKRIANVKDSGWLIPGHGGILDRLDSIVFNLVVVYYFVLWEIQQKGWLF